MTRPLRTNSAIVWATFLGANTSHRLALEWNISLSKARMRLQYACETGVLVANRSYKPLRYAPSLRSMMAEGIPRQKRAERQESP